MLGLLDTNVQRVPERPQVDALPSSVAIDQDGLGLEVVVQTVFREFTPDAGLFEATERCVDPETEVRVDVHVALLHLGSDAVGLAHVLIEDAAAHSIVGAVQNYERLIDFA